VQAVRDRYCPTKKGAARVLLQTSCCHTCATIENKEFPASFDAAAFGNTPVTAPGRKSSNAACHSVVGHWQSPTGGCNSTLYTTHRLRYSAPLSCQFHMPAHWTPFFVLSVSVVQLPSYDTPALALLYITHAQLYITLARLYRTHDAFEHYF